MRTQPEKNNVVIPCLKALRQLQSQGAVIEYKRLSEHDIDHKLGAPDIEVKVVKNGWLHIIAAECKSGRGRLRLSQLLYALKYKDVKNFHYIKVKSDDDLKNKIEEITGYFKKKLGSIKL